MAEKTTQIKSKRPPIVAVLGHVDHGKTTLLDNIRQTNVAAKEHGGITQHIGAYQVTVLMERSSRGSEAPRGIPTGSFTTDMARDDRSHKTRTITFIDTPGHEAFIKMRSRGAQVADIAILVVAADDSVKPQTKESIEIIKSSKTPMIVAINKIDLPTASIDKVKQDLAKNGVQVEGYGGNIPVVAVSAKQGTGIKDLLDLILLVADLQDIFGDPQAPVEAVVIETRVDKGKGMVATAIVKAGTLTPGEKLYDAQNLVGKVRAIFDEYGKSVQAALPGKPVEILGFTQLPPTGTMLSGFSREVVKAAPLPTKVKAEIPDFLKPIDEEEQIKLNIMIKADTAGSLEAIANALDEKIIVVASGIGSITEADVLQARASNAFIIGFNVRIQPGVDKLAQTEKVVIRTYTIIYELLDELTEVVAGLKEVVTQERELGVGQIIAEFPYDKQRIAGTKVASGRLVRGDKVKIVRDGKELDRARIRSIRHKQEDISRADVGIECGVLFDKKVDFQLNDAIIAVSTA